MLADLLWNIATSNIVLLAIGALAFAALIVGHVPFGKYAPVIGPYVVLAKFVSYPALMLLAFLVGVRISDDRAEARSLKLKIEAQQIDIKAANDAAARADAARAEMARQAEIDQERIEDYAERLKRHPNGACILGDDDFPDRLSAPKRSR